MTDNAPGAEYRGWPLLDEMPAGWIPLKSAGSPLSGYEFVCNGRSAFDGRLTALLRVQRSPPAVTAATPAAPDLPAATPVPATPAGPVDINRLARERMKLRLLADIRFDLQVCEIEGWGRMEYIDEILDLIRSIGNSERDQ